MTQQMSTKEVKRELGRRIETARQPEFLDARVRPYLGAEAGANGHWKTKVLQLDGTGAATLEIDLGGRKVFGKFFPDDSGLLRYEKLKALRAVGFGPGERYQVVEPLGFIPEYGMLLTRGVEGPAVSESIGADDDALVAGAMEAARWLAKLHTISVRIGEPRSLLETSEVLSVARRMAKVVNRRPGYLGRAVEMVRALEKLAESTRDGLLVQTHGQYRPIHVFLGGPLVTVIDLDRSRPGDPAYDVVEFIHRMRKTMFKYAGTVEPADAPTQAFLETYASGVPDRSYLANLPFHWARFVFHSLNKELKEGDGADLEFNPAARFCLSEFENVVEGRFGI